MDGRLRPRVRRRHGLADVRIAGVWTRLPNVNGMGLPVASTWSVVAALGFYPGCQEGWAEELNMLDLEDPDL